MGCDIAAQTLSLCVYGYLLVFSSRQALMESESLAAISCVARQVTVLMSCSTTVTIEKSECPFLNLAHITNCLTLFLVPDSWLSASLFGN
jgi:hypothetical protein